MKCKKEKIKINVHVFNLFSVFNTFNNFKQVLVSLVLVNFDSVKQTNCNNGLEVLACKINHKH